MELATFSDVCQPSSLILPAISHVFTIKYVAEKLAENEEWLWELSIDMFPEDGCLRVYGVGEDGVPAFTEYGIECFFGAAGVSKKSLFWTISQGL